MALVNGHTLMVRALKNEGVKAAFYLMGGPNYGLAADCLANGITAVDVRHEQAASMAAHAYARVTGTPGVCFGASGPGVVNMLTGVANAYHDAVPLIAIGGGSAIEQSHREPFQEVDQMGLARPVTKWCAQIVHTARIPEMMSMAFRHALSGRPGTVFLDVPGDVLNGSVEESQVMWPANYRTTARPLGDPALVKKAVDLLAKAQRPVIITGSGILWSGASPELQRFVDTVRVPFYTTPQGRGVIPEDHPLAFLGARSFAFRNADVVLVVGTRPNYVIGGLMPPRFSAEAKVVMVNVEAEDIGLNRGVDVGIVGDAKMVLQQLIEEAKGRLAGQKAPPWQGWLNELRQREEAHNERMQPLLNSDAVPIHPLRLCHELRKFMDRDAILCVDGNETLHFARQSIPSFVPAHRLNSGTLGYMGVGLPFGVGAKVAKPDKQVVVLHGDGSFGMNAMEIDTLVRLKLPVLTVICNNAGWTARSKESNPAGRDLQYTRYDLMALGLGAHSEHVERPEHIRPALERAAASRQPAVVNVIVDQYAKGQTTRFAAYEM